MSWYDAWQDRPPPRNRPKIEFVEVIFVDPETGQKIKGPMPVANDELDEIIQRVYRYDQAQKEETLKQRIRDEARRAEDQRRRAQKQARKLREQQEQQERLRKAQENLRDSFFQFNESFTTTFTAEPGAWRIFEGLFEEPPPRPRQEAPRKPAKGSPLEQLCVLAKVDFPTTLEPKVVYRKAMRHCHPDHGGSAEQWHEMEYLGRRLGLSK